MHLNLHKEYKTNILFCTLSRIPQPITSDDIPQFIPLEGLQITKYNDPAPLNEAL